MADEHYKAAVEDMKAFITRAKLSENKEEQQMDKELYKAAIEGDTSFFEKSENEDAYFLRKTFQGNNIIHVAVRHCQYDFAKAGVERFPELVSESNSDGDTPFHIAAERSFIKFMELLVSTYIKTMKGKEEIGEGHIIPWRMKNKEGNTPLHLALIHRNINVAKLLLEGDPKLTRICNNMDETPLHLAAILDDKNALCTLVVEEGAAETLLGIESSLRDFCGRPIDVIELLLKLDRSVACWRDKNGLTPLLKAATLNSLQPLTTFQILYHCPESAETCDRSGNTILHLSDLTPYLFKHPGIAALKNNWDVHGNTAAHIAVKNHNIGLLKVLYGWSANFFIKNKEGVSAVDLMRQQPDDFRNSFRDEAKTWISTNHYLRKPRVRSGPSLHEFMEEIGMEENDKVENLIKQTLESWPSLICEFDNRGNTLLHIIVKKAPHLVNKQLLDTLDDYFKRYQKTSIEACIEEASLILPLKAKNEDGCTPLHIALLDEDSEDDEDDKGDEVDKSAEQIRCAKVMLEFDLELANEKDLDGRTPLYMLSEIPNEVLQDPKICADDVHFIIEKSRNVVDDKVGEDGLTPFLKASELGNTYFVILLLDECVRHRDNNKNTFMHLLLAEAWTPGRIKANKKFVKEIHAMIENNKIDQSTKFALSNTLKAVDNDGNTSLHLAIENENFKIALLLSQLLKLLPQRFPSSSHLSDILKIRNKNGKTPFDLAVGKSFPSQVRNQFIDIAIEHSDPSVLREANKNDGNTPLHLAIQSSQFGIAKKLIDKVSKTERMDKLLKIRNNKDETPRALIGSAEYLPYEFEDFLWRNPEMAALMLGVRSMTGLSTDNIREHTNTIGVTAALFATITFTAAFAVPGGLNSNNGTPLLLKEVAFQVFLISDVVAMCLSMIILFCLLWVMTFANRGHQVLLLDLIIFLLEGSFCTILLAFMTGLYVTAVPVTRWIALLTCVLCSLLIVLLLNKRFIINGLLPHFTKIFGWGRRAYLRVIVFTKTKAGCFCRNQNGEERNINAGDSLNNRTQEEPLETADDQAEGEEPVANFPKVDANSDSACTPIFMWLRKAFSPVRGLVRKNPPSQTNQNSEVDNLISSDGRSNQPPQPTVTQHDQGTTNEQADGEQTVVNLTQIEANYNST